MILFLMKKVGPNDFFLKVKNVTAIRNVYKREIQEKFDFH